MPLYSFPEKTRFNPKIFIVLISEIYKLLDDRSKYYEVKSAPVSALITKIALTVSSGVVSTID